MWRYRTPRTRNRRASVRSRRRPSLTLQPLEPRLLLVAEGAVYSFSGTFDTAGLVGDVSAQVSWGDGTQSAASSIVGGNVTGNLTIRFDYSLDTGGFFAGANSFRRDVLQAAADALIQRFGDDLAAIVPDALREWTSTIRHPSSGPANALSGNPFDLVNPTVGANEIIIYAGARDLPGDNRGVGGPASFSFPATQFTCQSQAECDAKEAQINAFRDLARGRGEPGALASPNTDVAPSIGSVAFDNQSNWYFGTDPNGIQPSQVDFMTVATHEIAHVLGFGISRTDATSSWDRAVSGGVFQGANVAAAYLGPGSPPIQGDHWGSAVLDQYGQATLMAAEVPTGQRQIMTPLDFAAMDDLGWDLLSTQATITAQHRFGDDGTFPVELRLIGSRANEIVLPIDDVTVTNVAPTLTVLANQNGMVDLPIVLTDLGQITDPGFGLSTASPPSTESFTYSIDWGDGTPVDIGQASIDRLGDPTGNPTLASFNGTHTYTSVGSFTVVVRVNDDDGGAAERTFVVSVAAPPAFQLQLSRSFVGEQDGPSAASLTISRNGPPRSVSQTIQLTSSDQSEATVPATAVIPSGQTEVTVAVDAIDDALLDGDVSVTISASAVDAATATIDLLVQDHETLALAFDAPRVTENASGVSMRVRRSNTDVVDPLSVQISGGDAGQLQVPTTITIPATASEIQVTVVPINDSDAEPVQTLVYTVTAPGYQGDQATIDLLDDEPPLFQNSAWSFDVNNDNQVTGRDALFVVNEIGRRTQGAFLDPNIEQPGGIFLDVNGDYMVTALDALIVIIEMQRTSMQQTTNGEQGVSSTLWSIQTFGQTTSDNRLDEYRPWMDLVGPRLT